jgi:hypothetical protein
MPQVVLEHALLGRDLCARVEVLLAAAPTYPEVTATRSYTRSRWLQHLLNVRKLVIRFLDEGRIGHPFARQRPLDENHFAVGVRDTTAFLIQRLNARGIRHDKR